MCSIDDGEHHMKCTEKIPIQNTCMKCKTNESIVVVRIHDPLCKDCFLTYITHKFRSTLGKARLIQANDNVLLASSGGHSSMAMIQLAYEALSEKAHKRLRFTPAVIHIDESCLIEETSSEFSIPVIEKLACFARDLGMKFYSLPIYKGFVSKNFTTEKDSFLDFFSSMKSLTAKSDFLSNLRMSLIADFAKKNDYKKVMIGDCATRLAIKLLSNVAQGRGSSISQDIGVGDYRYENLIAIRPMREFSPKELVVFNRIRNIKFSESENLDTKSPPTSSIQRQTEEFILGLQDEFPSTVNTVFRTGDKICSSGSTKLSNKCTFCYSQLDKFHPHENPQRNEKEIDNLYTDHQINNLLCYGCLLTFKEKNDNSSFSTSDFLQQISHKMQQMKMKDEIADYLLEGD